MRIMNKALATSGSLSPISCIALNMYSTRRMPGRLRQRVRNLRRCWCICAVSGNSPMAIWSVLGIEATQDISAIKRAYARQLKNTRPDQDPEAYQRLREAFESARRGDYVWNASDAVTYSSPLLPMTDDALISRTQVHHLVSDTVSLLLENEQAGVALLKVCLSEELLQNLQLREMFSQQLAWDLAEREGLTRPVLVNVAALMGWEI